MSEIFLFRGFSKEQIVEGQQVLADKGENLTELIFVPASHEMLQINVEELLNMIEKKGQQTLTDATEGLKTVIMAVSSQEKALTIMRTYKSLLKDPTEPAFAMITSTSLTWTLGYYMDHIHKEHEFMKTHNPADDPDMKKIN
jgi:hypothetical protein